MDDHLSSIQNDTEDDTSNPLIKIEQDNMIESSILSDLPKNEPGEEMIMVDPSLITSNGDEPKSTTVPINLILQDGSVLQLNAVTNGDLDLATLQNLVSTQLLQEQPDSKCDMVTFTTLPPAAPIAPPISSQALTQHSFVNESVVSANSNVLQNLTLISPSSSASSLSTPHITVTQDILQQNTVTSDLLQQNIVTSSFMQQNVVNEDLLHQDVTAHFVHNGIVNTSFTVDVTEKQSTERDMALAISPITKQKGGWPKGKKRKPEKLVNAPKPPITAYGRFTQVRRIKLREEKPLLSFAELVKIMGSEWSSLDKQEKQKYFDEAAADKQRYINDLAEYQKSEEYQAFLAKQRAKGKNDSSLLYTTGINRNDDVLHCEVCDLYFSNQHNRKEHFLGQRHINNVTKLYEADLAKQRQALGLDGQGVEAVTVEVTEVPSLPPPLDMDSFMTSFILNNQERENELRHLRERHEELTSEHEQLQLKFQQLKSMEEAYRADLATMKTYGAALSAQSDGLSLVPNLFRQLQL